MKYQDTYQNKYYDLVMYRNAVEIGTPVLLIQTIIFLVKLIGDSQPLKIVEYLTSIATDPLIPHQIEDMEFRESAYEMIRLKLQTIQNLISTHKAGRN